MLKDICKNHKLIYRRIKFLIVTQKLVHFGLIHLCFSFITIMDVRSKFVKGVEIPYFSIPLLL